MWNCLLCNGKQSSELAKKSEGYVVERDRRERERDFYNHTYICMCLPICEGTTLLC